MAGTLGVVDHMHLGQIDDLPCTASQASADVGILTIHEEPLIEALQIGEDLGGEEHEQTGYPIRP